ncbi:hypothetical protein POM88_016725 [Heracleum sosnowskyi]|uniref:TFIIS N-terminal domain-containing protein n=1 Tax=Heracleum sosnowskyi TaxID=360622 RepID=A0AAD8MXP3_9APIA|nr:hypothetical protein POM88_016725 [Heracleum sosnowskyi]
MTLEDFFTLTEMKDGLTALDRIKELVNMMQEEKSSTVKNVGDAVRQWSTVASIIAVTENKDCLDLFLQLDGLDYLVSWLKDAQKFGKETSDSFVEESITAILAAVEKLHTNTQKSVNTEIMLTVKNLLGYSSSKVQDKARMLFNSWKQNNNSVLTPQDASVLGAGCENQINVTASTGADGEHPECSSRDSSHSGGSHNEGVSSSGNVGADVSGAKEAMKNMDHKLEIFDGLATYSFRIEDTKVTEESIGQHADQPENDLELSRSAVGSKDSDVTDKRSGTEHDYSTIAPLEVSQQVTIEVNGQIDCRDKRCSSSERTSCGGISLSRSLDSINGKNGKVINVPSTDIPNEPDSYADSGDGAFITAENQTTGQESQTFDMAVAHVGFPDLGTEPNKDERICGFDLNEEKVSDDMEHSIYPLAAPLSVISASRAAATSGIPDAPLQFEGTLGWKVSAETSAFHSAPPRQISESEKYLVASGSRDISEQRQNYLDFDLNVTDALEDDKITDLMLGKQILNSSDRPYGNSHVKVSPRKSDLLQLDLNCVSYDDDAPAHLRAEGKHLQHQSGHRSPSASSSSSMQPTLRNIDLNDQPSIFNDFSDPGFIGKSSRILSAGGGFKPDDSAKVDINQKNLVPQISPFLNGRISDYEVDTSSSRSVSVLGMGSTLPYAPSPGYGYNVPPSVPIMPYSSAMYGLGGHIPCMVDSKGSPVVPQILGSPSAIPTAYPQPPFIMSMTATPTSSNVVRPLQNDFDLNMGLFVDGGNRDTGGVRHLFNSGQGRQSDDHLRANPPISSSGVGGKRKETDGGLELFPFNYKHHQSPWK